MSLGHLHLDAEYPQPAFRRGEPSFPTRRFAASLAGRAGFVVPSPAGRTRASARTQYLVWSTGKALNSPGNMGPRAISVAARLATGAARAVKPVCLRPTQKVKRGANRSYLHISWCVGLNASWYAGLSYANQSLSIGGAGPRCWRGRLAQHLVSTRPRSGVDHKCRQASQAETGPIVVITSSVLLMYPPNHVV